MSQSLHVLSTHIIFSTKERRPWLKTEIRPRVWAYIARVLQNLECHAITVGGVEDHIHILCNLTKKHASMKVMEIVKTLGQEFAAIFMAEWIRLVQRESGPFLKQCKSTC